MILLTNKGYESCLNQTNCHICKKSLKMNKLLIKIIEKLKTIVIIQVNKEGLHVGCDLKCSIPK